jgi:hypothetical protein
MLTLTQKALEEFDNQHDFERMCADVLNSLGYQDVVLIAPKGGSDGGRDITFTTPDGKKGLACVSLREDSNNKFNEDFGRRTKGEYEKYVFFTNRYLTFEQKLKYQKYCIDSLEAELLPQDREALRSLLDSALKEVRKKWLHIDDESSAQLKKRIFNWLKYQQKLPPENYRDRASLAEWVLTTAVQREIYYVIADVDDDEIKLIPGIGDTLWRFKEHYYNLCLRLNVVTKKSHDLIHTQTRTLFQFQHGWQMIYKYILLRLTGQSPESVSQQVPLNYDISPEQCEATYQLVFKDKVFAEELTSVGSELEQLDADIQKITTMLGEEITSNAS